MERVQLNLRCWPKDARLRNQDKARHRQKTLPADTSNPELLRLTSVPGSHQTVAARFIPARGTDRRQLLGCAFQTNSNGTTLTCVGGKWLNAEGKLGLSGFSCVSCLQIVGGNYKKLDAKDQQELYFVPQIVVQVLGLIRVSGNFTVKAVASSDKWVFEQKDCGRYSPDACKAAAIKGGWKIGGPVFAGPWGTKGCYVSEGGEAYYGEDGTVAEMEAAPGTSQHRPEGYAGCEGCLEVA